jgi:hypothetical protein
MNANLGCRDLNIVAGLRFLLQRRYSRPVDKITGVRCDHTVILTAIDSVKVYPDTLRRVNYFDVETGKRFKFR